MPDDAVFPFGQKMQQVVQVDRTPKKVFILGVYGSAVHARWLDAQGQTRVHALAVASEPEIFWRGENAAEIIARIHIPPKLGTLIPAGQSSNGPSGRALDSLFLEPLGCSRGDVWLCDMVPHACLNPRQQQAIAEHYQPVAQPVTAGHGLPQATIPPVPHSFADDARRQEIFREIEAAQPRLIILLGDQPIRWFLSFYREERRLADFGQCPADYGRVHECRIQGQLHRVLPLVHPRQAGGLSSHSTTWKTRHSLWIAQRAQEIRREYLAG